MNATDARLPPERSLRPIEVQPAPFDNRTWLVFLFVMATSIAYAAAVLLWGWLPSDEGLLAHSAERVLNGQVPHRDFQDAYGGLLSYVHATAFRVWGLNLASLRFVLFAFFVLFVPAVFWISTRIVNCFAAGVATLIAVAWSIPNYPASMPSWYNLFFATFGLAAIFYYIEAPSEWLLFLAGLCAGISCLFKIVGLYFVAAALLFFLGCCPRSNPKARPSSTRFHRLIVMCAAIVFLAAVVLLLRSRFGAAEIYHFFLPQLAIAAVAVWGTRSTAGSSQWALRRTIPVFLLGVLLPIAAFTLGYARIGALRDLVNGVFNLPTKRLALAGRSPASLASVLPMALALCLVSVTLFVGKMRCRVINLVLALGFILLLIFSANSSSAFTFAWDIFATLIPAVVVLTTVTLRRPDPNPNDERLMLLASALAVCSLVQYPFSNAAYFCYVAPLLVLTIAALLKRTPLPTSTLCIIAAFALFFPAVRLRPFMERDGFTHIALVRLDLPRVGGLRVRSDQAREYEQLVRLVQQHAPAGSYIYAATDGPQVYFLSGMHNPTPVLYSMFDERRDRSERILHAIASHQVAVVVVDTDPVYAEIPPDLLRELQSQFPQSASAGHFQVRWRP